VIVICEYTGFEKANTSKSPNVKRIVHFELLIGPP